MTEHRRPGRPQIADPDQISRLAAEMFAERGYTAVSMDDVAASSGVSRRTLFRHFDNKADLVWRDIMATYARIQEHLERPGTAPGIAGLRSAAHAVLPDPLPTEDLSRVRLRIIGDSAEVFGPGFRAMTDMTAGLARHFARDGDYEPGSLEANAAAQAVIGAVLTAAVWWARHSDDPLVDVIDRALALLERGLD